MSEHERVPPLGEIKATRRDEHEPRPQGRAKGQPQRPAPAQTPASGNQEYNLLLGAAPPRALGMLQQVLATLVRLLGLCFLIVGIGASVIILNEAWMLYKEPARIERFALAIESGSNLDKIFAMSGSEIVKSSDRKDTPGDSSVSSNASEPADEANLRLSYFAGWFLVLLLMLVASITAIAAVSAGGRLVLYDTDVRQLSRAVIKEISRNKGD